MRKLAKYLKPYTMLILACIILLFGEAICDLNLPNMMSRIVNVGIQQGGIEGGAPQAISKEGMQLLKNFMTEKDQTVINTAYTVIPAASAEYKKEYPLSAKEDIWVLSAKKDEKTDMVYDHAVMTLMNLQKLSDHPLQGKSNAMPLQSLKGLYEMPALKQIPADIVTRAQQSAVQTPASQLNQVGIVMTKLFYQELGVDTAKMQSLYVWKTGFYMLLLTLAGVLAAILVGFCAARVSAGMARTLRRDIFNQVEHFSNAEFDNFSTASLITRSTNDVSQVQTLMVMGLRMICFAPIMGIGGIIMAVRKSVSMSWIIAVGVAVLLGLMAMAFSAVIPRFKKMQKLVDKLNLVTRENLSGMMVIRAFGTQKFEEERFDRANGELTDNQLFVNRVMAFMMPAMMFLMNAISLEIVWVGAHQIEQSTMLVGDMMAFMQYAMQIIMSFLMISMMFILVPRAAVSAERIAEVLEVEQSVKDPQNPKTLGDPVKGKIEFRKVNFRYSNAEDDVLQNISFTALPGQVTAFIGSTGSGKSTLINLIPRFYDVTSGEILLDGVNIKDITMHELRENIGYVPQKGILFSGDISTNLRYGVPEATEEEIVRCAEAAQAMEFISTSPNGMKTDISQGGTNVSGGQKQRISIARALTKKAPVYIFDDSFSALDFKTDATLRRTLAPYIENSTMLLVAQRVSTIMHAQQIIVLDEGNIVGIGTHGELLQNCPVYHEIAVSQLSEEELQ